MGTNSLDPGTNSSDPLAQTNNPDTAGYIASRPSVVVGSEQPKTYAGLKQIGAGIADAAGYLDLARLKPEPAPYSNEGRQPAVTDDTTTPITVSTTGPRPPEEYGPDNQRGKSALAQNAGVISSAVNSGLPPGITRTGNSYSGVGTASQAPGMTTEQANEYYGGVHSAMNARDQANEAANLRAANQAMTLQSNQAVASQATREAEDMARRANTPRAVRDAQARLAAARTTQMGANTAQAGIGAGYNAMGEAATGEGLVSKAREQQIEQRKQTVGEAESAQKLQLGQYQLAQQKHLSDLAAQAASGDQKATETLALWQRAMRGEGGSLTPQDRAHMWMDQVTKTLSSPALMANPNMLHGIPSFAEFNAQLDSVGKPGGAQPGAGQQAQYGPEGSQHTDAHGNLWTITNGKPVLTKANTSG